MVSQLTWSHRDDNLGLYYNRARYLNPDTGRFWTMDTFAGNNEDPLSLHKYLYCQGDPVMGTDLSGLNTVLVVRDPDVPAYASGAGADSAASHFQKAGWTVVRLDSTGFINYNQQYDGIVTSGHGDDQLSASLTVGIIKASLTQTHSRLEVGIFLSCHSTAFARPLLSPQCSTGNALFITYSGYGASIATRRWRVGKMIDAWVANPKQTEYDLYNPADDLIGTISYGIVRPAAIAAWNALGNILDEMPDLSGIMD
jgi:RHS repeat-associated protein